MKNKLYLSLVVTALLCVGVWSVYAQRSNPVKQTWEFKFIFLVRGFEAADSRGLHQASPWSAWFEDAKPLPGPINMISKAKELGDQGWELVAVTPMSAYAARDYTNTGGVSVSYAGFDNHLQYVFKRQK
jgi:hypothetical protein